MFIPKIYQVKDHVEIMDFIQKYSFAMLVNVDKDGLPVATHIPIEIDFSAADNPTLRGHVSKANPQAQLFGEGATALAIFTGAHSYISSSWYGHENVSTWNYSAVHIYGKIRQLNPDELWDNVSKLTARYEALMARPRLMSDMSEDYLKREIRGIVGFEMAIEDVQAKAKLSQNRNQEDFKNIIQELERSNDPNAHQVAADMRAKRPQD